MKNFSHATTPNKFRFCAKKVNEELPYDLSQKPYKFLKIFLKNLKIDMVS
jgi:hypothetical protein